MRDKDIKPSDPTLIAFGLHLLNLRRKAGLSQEKLSELTNLDNTHISALERARRNPSLTALIKLSKGLNVPHSEMLNFKIDD